MSQSLPEGKQDDEEAPNIMGGQLIGGIPIYTEKDQSSSVGMMTFPAEWKNNHVSLMKMKQIFEAGDISLCHPIEDGEKNIHRYPQYLGYLALPIRIVSI